MPSIFRHGGSLPLPKLPSQSMQSRIPAFLYGTAWKKERSTDLVFQALKAGFVGIDTAAQPKHYREDLVGEGVKQFLIDSPKGLKRKDIYVTNSLLLKLPPSRTLLTRLTPDPNQVHADKRTGPERRHTLRPAAPTPRANQRLPRELAA